MMLSRHGRCWPDMEDAGKMLPGMGGGCDSWFSRSAHLWHRRQRRAVKEPSYPPHGLSTWTRCKPGSSCTLTSHFVFRRTFVKISGKSSFCAAPGGGNGGKALRFLNEGKGKTCITNGRDFLPPPTTAMMGAATACFEVLSFRLFAIICARPFQQKHSLLVVRDLAEGQKAGFLY